MPVRRCLVAGFVRGSRLGRGLQVFNAGKSEGALFAGMPLVTLVPCMRSMHATILDLGRPDLGIAFPPGPTGAHGIPPWKPQDEFGQS